MAAVFMRLGQPMTWPTPMVRMSCHSPKHKTLPENGLHT
jgi:hypothetical protein